MMGTGVAKERKINIDPALQCRKRGPTLTK